MTDSTKRIAVFPGSFDPLHRGHIDIAMRATSLFDSVVLAVIKNPAKEALLSVEERTAAIESEFADVEGVEVDSFEGLLVDYLKKTGRTIVIRGLRATSDYDYEAQMALMNKNLYSAMETVFFMAREEHSYVSSSLVKQIAPLGGDVAKLVSPGIEKVLKARYAHS